MTSQIKGLSQFIADLRSSNTPEAERARVQAELASVRKKIASGKTGRDYGWKNSKNGYEHRKIVSKLLYIYILGYDVDLGNDEINALLHMPKFAEKQCGYLALEILLGAHKELKSSVEPVVMEDLRSTKEVYTSLALNYVSTWHTTRPVSDNLADLVYQLMVSPTSSTPVVKKAALTFLNFFRQDPSRFLTDSDWPERVERISAILAAPNLGVATSVVSLLTEIAIAAPNSFEPQAFTVVARKLEDVFDGDGDEAKDYRYYQIFAPWLVAKLCKLLEVMYSPTYPLATVKQAHKVVTNILSFCVDEYDDDKEAVSTKEEARAQQRQNACNVMFYNASRLGTTLNLYENDRELTRAVIYTVKGLISAEEANLRYFALDLICHLHANVTSGLIDTQIHAELTNTVLKHVKDRDHSIRRKALDALFLLVNRSNVETVAAELLNLLVASDLMIRPLMVARLAVILEKYATSHEWYFDSCITLLEIGGNYAGDEVWQRLAQIVVNNEAIQSYAVKRVHDTLNKSEPAMTHAIAANPVARSDSIIKLGAFILGEFGQLYTGDKADLFLVLQDQIDLVHWQTKIILLTAYLKFAVKFPALRPAATDAISFYCKSPDLETQQRANEYMRLLQPANAALLASLTSTMPAFEPENSATLYQQMGQPLKPTPRTSWQASGPIPTLAESQQQLQTQQLQLLHQHKSQTYTGAKPPLSKSSSFVSSTAGSATGPLLTNDTGNSLRQIHLSSNWEFGFRRMLTHSEAILYQDALLQIGCNYEFKQATGSIKLYVRNISSYGISSLTVQVKNPMSDNILTLNTPDLASGISLAAGQMIEQRVLCEAKQAFALTPLCRITYLAGSFFETNIKLPITLERFMSPSAITLEQFNQRWDLVGTECEFTKQFKNFSVSRASKSVDNDADVVRGMQYGIVPGAPGNTILGASIIHTSQGGKLGSLIVVQPDADHSSYKTTVRVTHKKLAAVVLANNFAHAYQL